MKIKRSLIQCITCDSDTLNTNGLVQHCSKSGALALSHRYIPTTAYRPYFFCYVLLDFRNFQLNPSVAETGVFRNNLVENMAADGLVPCVKMSSIEYE